MKIAFKPKYVCDPYEDPDCGCTNSEEEVDEDLAYYEARERMMEE